MSSTISTTIPIGSEDTYESPVVAVNNGGTKLTGTVFADQAGLLFINQSSDGINFDGTTQLVVEAGVGLEWSVLIFAPWIQVVYENGSVTQTVFRLYGNVRDDNGNFISPQTPSSGGQFAVLQATSNGSYVYVGRFDGNTGWDACGFAAISQNHTGKYAAFDVSTGTVADETVVRSTDSIPASF